MDTVSKWQYRLRSSDYRLPHRFDCASMLASDHVIQIAMWMEQMFGGRTSTHYLSTSGGGRNRQYEVAADFASADMAVLFKLRWSR